MTFAQTRAYRTEIGVDMKALELSVGLLKQGLWLFTLVMFSSKKIKVRIVTGADTSHARSLNNLLTSIQNCTTKASVTIYDLGLSDIEAQELGNRARLMPGWEVKKFQYKDYPDYFAITNNAGEYAWKPVIIESELDKNQGEHCLFWLDAGNIVPSSLRMAVHSTMRLGLWSPNSQANVETWTHKTSQSKFGIEKRLLRQRNRSGGIVGINVTSPVAACAVHWWSLAAQSHEWIAPPGSSRANHRQDQSLLTMICYRLGVKTPPRGSMGILTQQDAEGDKK